MTEYVKARLTTKFGKWYPFIRFDYALSWNAEYRSGFAAFCVAVMSSQWEENWESHLELFARTGQV